MISKEINAPSSSTTWRLWAGFFFNLALLYFMYQPELAGGGGSSEITGFSLLSGRLKFCFPVLIASVTIVILLPVVVRGSRLQKILAAMLCLLPAWFAYQGWSEIIIQTLSLK